MRTLSCSAPGRCSKSQAYRNDLAALRAFILLRQVAPDAYGRIPLAMWEKWTPALVALPRQGATDGAADLDEVLRDAFSRAPAIAVGTVTRIIRIEKERVRTSSDNSGQSSGPPFLVLRDLRGCWHDENLKIAIFEELKAVDIRLAEFVALLEPLAAAGFEPAIEHGVARLGELGPGTIEIADLLLRCAPVRVWPALQAMLAKHDELARELLLHAAAHYSLATPFYAALDEEAIADIYLLMERLFPPEEDQKGPSGFVSPLEAIPYLRDGAPRCLAAIGTEKAVAALRQLVAERPGSDFLRHELSRGELEMRLKTWSPLTPREVLALADRPETRLVTSAAELLGILVEALEKFATELHGAQTPVRDLWDRQGTKRVFRPIDENGFSDVIARFLRRELGSSGIFANREVEVSRRPGAPVGQRTDILVNTVRRRENGEPFNPITAVIETKGCWNKELFTALEAQLVHDYMVKLNAPVGIYLVGWFDSAQWDKTNNRRGRVASSTINEVRDRLEQQAAAAPEGFLVHAIVLDIRAP